MKSRPARRGRSSCPVWRPVARSGEWPPTTGRSVQSPPRLLERLGFDAVVDGLEIRLGSCPCPDVSPEHPELICRLAGAAIDGIAEASPRRLRVSSSTHDPERRTCTVLLAPRPPLFEPSPI
ncbi:MAG TPA: hypothetical protein VIJ51_19610 [Solirubrobacteraceae bacterium]